MKKITTLSVDAVDFKTWLTYPGFDEFSEKYAAYKREMRTYFYFTQEQEEIKEEAKKFLNGYALKYGEYFSIELDNDDELKNYPVVLLSFYPVKYPIILEKKGKTYIGPKTSKKNFQYDIYSGRQLVITQKAKDFFEAHLSGLQFQEVFDAAGKQKWYIVSGFTPLQNPPVYPENTIVKPGKESGFYTEGNGKFDYPDEALAEIQEHKLLLETTFTHNGILYNSPFKSFPCSGAFAFEFKQHFNMKKDWSMFFYPTLKYW